jgi:signal transduction histidine kinase
MSRSSRPTSWCSRAPVDLCAVAASALEQFAPAAEQKGIRLALEHGNAVGVALRADPHRLDQVFMNLVGNALKFPPTGGTVTVALTADADAVEAAVVDTGPGIPRARFRCSSNGSARGMP